MRQLMVGVEHRLNVFPEDIEHMERALEGPVHRIESLKKTSARVPLKTQLISSPRIRPHVCQSFLFSRSDAPVAGASGPV